jgi:hypothetical protein
MIYQNKDVYEGEWHIGLKHGQGKYTFDAGGVYSGAWKNGNMDGEGSFTYPNGDVYEG